MQVEIKIDASCEKPKVIILTPQMTDEIHLLVKRIAEESPQVLSGFRDEKLEVLEQAEILRIKTFKIPVVCFGCNFPAAETGTVCLRKIFFGQSCVVTGSPLKRKADGIV